MLLVGEAGVRRASGHGVLGAVTDRHEDQVRVVVPDDGNARVAATISRDHCPPEAAAEADDILKKMKGLYTPTPKA